MSRDALVVGINRYQDRGLSDLSAPAEDAEVIANLLEKHGNFRVWRLPEAINEKGSLYVGKKTEVKFKQLEDALIQLFNPESKDIPDTALFYFSGHGIRISKSIGRSFLATSNTDLDEGFYGLSLSFLRELLAQSPIKQQIVWLDCCYAGGLLKPNLTEANPGEIAQARDRCFIASSREFEKSWVDIGSSYSVVTKVIIEGLNPNCNVDEWIDNYTLINYIKENIDGLTQRPIYSNSGEPVKLIRSWHAKTETTKPEETSNICPYKGLRYFDDNDEDYQYFYGREELTDRLLDKVRTDNFVAVVGASGSGKSSVLRAGLLHQLKQGQKLATSKEWEYLIMLPSDRLVSNSPISDNHKSCSPMSSLASAFVDQNLPRLERAEQLGKAEGLLKKGADGLRRLIQTNNAPRTVLVIDQFEEVFTLCDDLSEREKFFQCLLGALEIAGEKFCLILGMRADFFGKCLEREYSGLARKIEDSSISVLPMNEGQLRRAISIPARKANLDVEPELVTEILRDVNSVSERLPLLQDALNQLWKHKTDNCLTLASYTNLGRIENILNQRATEVYNCFDEEQKNVTKYIFLSLTQLGENTEDTRRRVLKKDLITNQYPEGIVSDTIQKLADERLIVTNESKGNNSGKQKPAVVDVAHEALIRNWLLLREWLSQSRENILKKRKIEAAAKEWQENGRKSDYLFKGKRLQEAKEFQQIQSPQFPLSNLVLSLIDASIKARRIDRLKGLAIFLIFLLIVTPIAGWLIYTDILVIGAWDTLRTIKTNRYNLQRRYQGLKNINQVGQAFKSIKNNKVQTIDISKRGLGEKVNPSFGNLSGVDLNGVNLSEANLSGVDLNEVNLSEANLSRANLNKANLSKANLSRANLSRANLIEINLSYANLSETVLNIKTLNFNNIKTACNWEQAKYGYWDGQQSKWIIDPEAVDRIRQDKTSDPDKPIDCTRWLR